MVIVAVLVAMPLVSVGGRGESMEMGGVFDGPRDRCNVISIGLSWDYCIGTALSFVMEKFLGAAHEGEFMCIMTVDVA